MGDKYKNEKGVYFDVHTDKRGNDHIDVYDNDPREDHESIHIKFDSRTGSGTIVDTTDGTKETTDIKCFLTTACMRHQQVSFDDECEELNTLRWFRDVFVSDEDIKHYYEVAPQIVLAIEKSANSDKIYNYIYKNVVKTCVNAIKYEDYDFAYSRYKCSILALEECFLKSTKDNNMVKCLRSNTNS